MKANKRMRKWMIILVVIFGIGILTIGVLNGYIVLSNKDDIYSDTGEVDFYADCVLILGAGVWANDEPSPMLRDRLEQGIAIYKAGLVDKILMSGDHGREGYDEVNVMKNFAINEGVPSEDIFMDHAGFSTYESMYRAKEIFGVENMIVVTQKYHMYRALFIAKSFDINAIGINSDPREYAGQMTREVREWVARVKDLASTIIKPQPTYLGDKIDITGNGDVTNDKK